MLSPASSSPRIEAFRLWLADVIPIELPGKPERARQIKEDLHTKDLTDLLVIYLSWRQRLIVPRPRKVKVLGQALDDPRWAAHKTEIDTFLKKVKDGGDLSPHLSRRVFNRGYWPPAHKQGGNKWGDKDFLLNVAGFYHFHFSSDIDADGLAVRGDDVLFARVGRDIFEVLSLFDHSVFKMSDVETMTPERQRVWDIHDALLAEEASPGAVLVTGMIALSGHSISTVMAAQRAVRRLRQLDALLDDPEFLQRQDPSLPLLTKPSWTMVHDRLAILEGNQAIQVMPSQLGN